MPKEIVKRADDVLAEILEKHNITPVAKQMPVQNENATLALGSFINDEICDEIKRIDINTITPIEALTKLYSLRKMLDENA